MGKRLVKETNVTGENKMKFSRKKLLNKKH